MVFLIVKVRLVAYKYVVYVQKVIETKVFIALVKNNLIAVKKTTIISKIFFLLYRKDVF